MIRDQRETKISQENSLISEITRGYRYFRHLPKQFTNALRQNDLGIVEIGAGSADLAPGLRMYLLNELGVDTPVLTTDIMPPVYSRQYETASQTIDRLFNLEPGYLSRFTDAYGFMFNKATWEKARKGLFEVQGREWDARELDFYEKALQKLQTARPDIKRLALWIRQPALADYDGSMNPYNRIIEQMVFQATKHQAPVLIGVSSRRDSVSRCFPIVDNAILQEGYLHHPSETEQIDVDAGEWKERITHRYSKSSGNVILVIIEDTLESSLIDQDLDPRLSYDDRNEYYGGKRRVDRFAFMIIPDNII